MDATDPASHLIASGAVPANSVLHFEVATPNHDAALRRLLRDNPMPGWISLSLEREPSYFAAAALEGEEHQTIIATEAERLICAGSVSARRRWINGQAMRVGYLGGLRLDASCRGRAAVIRRGYELFRHLHGDSGPPIYLSSIVASNRPAQRILERGLSGMPTYKYLGEFVTLAVRIRRGISASRSEARVREQIEAHGFHLAAGTEKRKREIAQLLEDRQRGYQFGPVWRADELKPESFQMICAKDGTPIACAAIWDQRAIKQTVVRGYSNGLPWARPFINCAAAITGRPGLQPIGGTIRHVFLSHLAVDPSLPQTVEWLIVLLNDRAVRLEADYLCIGFDARDPRLASIRKAFRPREYVSRLYCVHWEDGSALAEQLDARLLAPEVALL